MQMSPLTKIERCHPKPVNFKDFFDYPDVLCSERRELHAGETQMSDLWTETRAGTVIPRVNHLSGH